jgi:hypothetical protein
MPDLQQRVTPRGKSERDVHHPGMAMGQAGSFEHWQRRVDADDRDMTAAANFSSNRIHSP